MKYFVAWTHSDPVYQQYLPDARVLISPPNVSQTWQIRSWASQPSELIIDSGAFQHYRAGRSPNPQAVLEQQLHIVADMRTPVAFCHLDLLVARARNATEADAWAGQSLRHARWLINALPKLNNPSAIEPIGVIQGQNVEQIFYVAQALADMGYQRFALGSLAGMVSNARGDILRRVEAALEAVGTRIHVLGIGSAGLLAELAQLGVESADSSSPIKEAARGGVIYSNPYRRFKLASAHFREWSRNYGFAEILEEPLPCDCPICREDPLMMLELRGKRAVNQRAVHNYYHLRRCVEA